MLYPHRGRDGTIVKTGGIRPNQSQVLKAAKTTTTPSKNAAFSRKKRQFEL